MGLSKAFHSGDLITSSRYAINDLIEKYNEVNYASSLEQEAFGELLTRPGTQASKDDNGLALTSRTIAVQTRLTSTASGIVGRTLIDLDVELRRTLSYVSDGSMRPYRDRGAVDLHSIRQTSSTEVLVVLSGSFYQALTSRPFDFLCALLWFWDHRINQTRTRRAKNLQDQLMALNELSELMRQQLRSNLPILISIDVDESGSTYFGFVSR